MTGARVRQHNACPCAGQALSHSPQKRAVMMTGVDARPLIQSREHKRQAERGRQQGSLPVRVDTLVSMSEANRARPEGVAIHLTQESAELLLYVIERHLRAIRSSIAFWDHEAKVHNEKLSCDLLQRKKESKVVQDLFLGLYDIIKRKNA